MEGGYIKLCRKLLDNPIMKKPDYLAVWLHLLLSVSYMDNKFIFNNESMFIKAGSMITSRDKICSATKLHRSKVERILKYFEIEQQIEQQTFNKFRIISIVNWCKYQINEQENEQPVSNKRATNEQPVSTIKNVKKVNNEKKVIIHQETVKEKIKYLECVLLTDLEHQKLIVKYGVTDTDKAIEILNNAVMSKGYKYKSHYHTIIGWVMAEVNRIKTGGNGNGRKDFRSSRSNEGGQVLPDETERQIAAINARYEADKKATGNSN